MKTISTILSEEQNNLLDDVTITSTGGIEFGSSASPTGSYSASMQFSGNFTLNCNGIIETYTTKVNMGVMFGKISGTYAYNDGVINLTDSTIKITAKNTTTFTTASGFWGGNLTFSNGIDSGSNITVESISNSTDGTISSAYANATGIYSNGSTIIKNGIAGSINTKAQGGYSAWGDAQSDGIYALGGVFVTGGISGSIDAIADGAGGGTSGEATASAITAGNKKTAAVAEIDDISGTISAVAKGGTLTGAISGSANGTSYGIYGSDGVTIGDFSGEISATGEGGNITKATKTAYSQGRAFGIYSDTGDIVFSNMNFGRIISNANGGVAALLSADYATVSCDVSAFASGLYTHSNIVIKNFNADITVNATAGGTNSTLYSRYGRGFAEAYAVFADKDIQLTADNIDSYGYINVSATAGNVGGWAYSGAIAAAISAGKRIVDTTIYTQINVSANGVLGRADSMADGYGIIAHDGIYNSHFLGDINVNVSASVTAGAQSQAHGFGIYCANRTFGTADKASSVGNITVNVTGSNGIGTNLPSTAYGIYAGWLNLEVHGTVSAKINGKNGYAIYVDHTAGYADQLHLRRNANFVGTVELMGGANIVYLYQGAKGLSSIQATGGTLELFFSFSTDLDSDAMANGADLTKFNKVSYYVAGDAISTNYCLMSQNYADYVSTSYSVLYDGIRYTVSNNEWTRLGESDKWIKIGVENGKFTSAIRVGDTFLGAGLNTDGQTYWDDMQQTINNSTLTLLAGAGRVTANSSCSMLGNIKYTIDNSTITSVYGGNSHAGGTISIYGDINFSVSGSTIGSFFGGGIGTNQTIEGNIYLNLNNTTITGAFYGIGAATVGNSSWTKNVNIKIVDSTLNGYFYGGTTSISTTAAANNFFGDLSIEFSGANTAVAAQVYSGSRYVSSVGGTSVISGKNALTISGGTFSNYIFGGSMAWGVNLKSDVEVVATVENGSYISISGGTFNHEIYGGGYAAANENSTGVNQASISKVNNGSHISVSNAQIVNLYGGGYNAGKMSVVNGGSQIGVSGTTTIGTIYGGGNGTGSIEVRANSIVNGGSHILIDGTFGGTISIGNIYGGGNNYCTVNGGSKVSFTGDFLGDYAELNFSGVLSGAGRHNSGVDGVKELDFANFNGNIDARVINFDKISLSGTTSAAFTREFSASQLSSMSFDCLASGIDKNTALVFGNTVSGWSENMVISIRLSSEVTDGSKNLIESLDSALTNLDGITYEFYFDDNDTAAYIGSIGDNGFVWNNYNFDLNLSDNNLNLSLDITVPTNGVSFEEDTFNKKSGFLALA